MIKQITQNIVYNPNFIKVYIHVPLKKNEIIILKIQKNYMHFKKLGSEFSCGSAGKGSGIVTIVAAVAQVRAMVQAQPLARELLHVADVAKKQKIKVKK